MSGHDALAHGFEANRPHLRAVAYRMLGSTSEAEDAVQEAWLRVSRSDASAVQNLGGWLTTITARICLDMLRSRRSRREEPLGPDESLTVAGVVDPEQQAVMADSVGIALLVVLETLTPSERVAFVLHDLFDLPFEDIAPVVGKSPAAARQLASRARRRVRGADTPNADTGRKREIVEAFLAASQGGDFDRLLTLLDPQVMAHVEPGNTVHGSRDVARIFAGRAKAAQVALIDGAPGLVWAKRRVPQVLFLFTFTGDRITAIDMVADPSRLASVSIKILGTRRP